MKLRKKNRQDLVADPGDTPELRNKKLIIIYYTILLLLLAVVLWAVRHFMITPSSSIGWTIISISSFVSALLGLVFSYLGTLNAHSADEGAKQLFGKLVETQNIVVDSPSFYPTVFRKHAIAPFERAIEARGHETFHLMSATLLISTPAYGYHVLGYKEHLEFRNMLAETRWKKQIILFIPDFHYYHVANTLLWHPLLLLVKPEDQPKANPQELKECISDTMDLLEQQMVSTQKDKSRSDLLKVWATSGTAFRLAFYEYSRHTNLFLILTDLVTLNSDLTEFRGRALAIPQTMHKQIAGDSDHNGYFEQFKFCPYCLGDPNDSYVKAHEFAMLKYDYIFLRTEQSLFNLACFGIECDRVIRNCFAKHKKEYPTPDDRQKAIVAIFRSVSQYYSDLFASRSKIAPDYFPSDSIQYKRLSCAGESHNMLSTVSYNSVDDLIKVLLRYDGDHIYDIAMTDYLKYIDSEPSPRNDPLFAKWVACSYFFLSSGFQASIYARYRNQNTISISKQPAIILGGTSAHPSPPQSPSSTDPDRKQS